MNTTTSVFEWDNNYDNTEQVRPYMADYMAVYDELTSAGKYPYNDSFKGRIPGISGSPREDTAIYLLQRLRDLDDIARKTDQVKEQGAYRLDERQPKPNEPGTLIHVGFYSGGTGWSAKPVTKVCVQNGRVQFKQARQKNWRTHYSGPEHYLFLPSSR